MARIEKSRKYIIDAMQILLEKKKYDDITINEIVEKAGVSRMTFYRQFYDKKEIVRTIIERNSNEYIEKIKNSVFTRELIVASFKSLLKGKDFAARLIEADLYNLVKEQFDKGVALFVKGYEGYFISGGIANVYYKYIINNDNYTAEELTNILLESYNLEHILNKDNK